MQHPDGISERVAILTQEISAAVHADRSAESIEASLLSALSEAAAQERDRCAGLAEERATMWQRTSLNDPGWPAGAREEAQARYKEAVAIADAIRAGNPEPPPV